MKEGVFVCPEIHQLVLEDEFKRKQAWEAFIQVVKKFLLS